jgi:tetratricopeptide (TPR) repeat protein
VHSTPDEIRSQAFAALEAGEFSQVESLATQLPDDPYTQWVRGTAAVRQGNLQEGYTLLEKSAVGDPSFVGVHLSIAETFERIDNLDQAVRAYQNALKIAPRDPNIFLRLAKLLLAFSRHAEAAEVLTRAVDLAPESGQARLLFAQALTGVNRGDEALVQMESALADPEAVGMAHGMLGYWYQARGKFAEARSHFEQSIQLEPRQALAYFGLTQGSRVRPEDRPILEQAATLISNAEVPPQDSMYLQYVLGKGMADLGEYESSWNHYVKANELAFEISLGGKVFNRRAYTEAIDGTIATFNRDFFKKNRSVGWNQRLPIFIVGMMRSGTTLVEQILSSHPEVGAAGELDFWLDEGYTAVDTAKRTLDQKALSKLALRYVDGLRRIAPDKAFVTDKMPQNFQMVGLIHTAFPKAPIIHIRRNPLDTCISIFTNAYQQSPNFAHDQDSIVFAYRQYQRLVAHWRRVLPPDQFLEIDYEDLTANPDFVIRQILSFCHLKWDDACLRPELNDRLVTTPSLWQVRQPVYRTAVERWRMYEPWLGGFAQLKGG